MQRASMSLTYTWYILTHLRHGFHNFKCKVHSIAAYSAYILCGSRDSYAWHINYTAKNVCQKGCYIIEKKHTFKLKSFGILWLRGRFLMFRYARVSRLHCFRRPCLSGLFDPNEMWLKWKALFLKVCDAHAPLKSKRLCPSKSSWITTGLKKRMNYRDHLKKKAVK